MGLGYRVVMRPLGDQPVEELAGKYRGLGPSTDKARRQAKAEDAHAQDGVDDPRMRTPPSPCSRASRRQQTSARCLSEVKHSLTALGVAEVLDHLVRLAGADEEEAALDLAQLGVIDGVPVDSSLGVAAGRLRARYYQRIRCAVSLADCVAAKVARSHQRPLATADPSLLDVCHAEDIGVVVVPGADGSRWSPSAT